MIKNLMCDVADFYSWVLVQLDGQVHLDDIDAQLLAAFILAIFY